MIRPCLASRRWPLAFLSAALACLLLGYGTESQAARPADVQFSVFAHPFETPVEDEASAPHIPLAPARQSAFAVVIGIKAAAEPCSDELYLERRNALNHVRKPVVAALAASDWTGCLRPDGRLAAQERLNRLRELFFVDDNSLGHHPIKLAKQSAAAKFRSYEENVRWNVGPVLFATLNLPANNNNYRPDAGRNNEFDDRLIASRNWLRRVFSVAHLRSMHTVVVFCDADPLDATQAAGRRDGFAEIRREIRSQAGKFDGEVLLIHGQGDPAAADAPAIAWEGNLGRLAAGLQALEVKVQTGRRRAFSVAPGAN